jgi:hypothetical protein
MSPANVHWRVAHNEASMARLIENPRRFNRAILLALLGLVLGMPICAQSNAADSTTPAGNNDASGSAQETKQTPAADAKTEPSPPASPEEIRQARIEEDTKKLFRLSAELRAEVAKTYKESLSLTVLKKAEEIEKLAKSLKALMDADAAAPKHKI